MYLRGFDPAAFSYFEKRRANHKNQAVIYIKRGVLTMQRKKSFVVVLAIIVFALGASGQGVDSLSRMSGRLAALPETIVLKRIIDLNKPNQVNTVMNTGRSLLFDELRVVTITGDYYTRHFGIMCQQELRFEKTTHIPLRFRLGSLEECNYLEGKR
jgi:hypothetical protein